MKKNVTIKITGKVQGVFFRASTKEKADELGLTGLVRNERDGSVSIEAEGEEDILSNFIFWCHRGPRLAKVEQCEIEEGEIKGFADFSISG
jgi:acylphosphatase